jgi:predicted DsbA family dithiol-disulfide isomerase
MLGPVIVEIWSDVVCPWCYLGKRRFERALASFDAAAQVEVVFRAFELDPTAPADRSEVLTEHLAQKYGVPLAQAQAMQDRVSGLAAQEGLAYRFDLARTARTFDAHRLIALGHAQQRQAAVVERLMAGYFSEGARINETAELARLGVEAGLDAASVQRVLAGAEYAEQVREDERMAASLGITGVPFFVVDRQLGVSGAQPVEVLGQMLQQGWDARAA